MGEEFEGTELKSGKPVASESEVEEFIKGAIQDLGTKEKKEEFSATPITPSKPAVREEKPKEKPKEKAAVKYEETFKGYEVGDIVFGKIAKVDPSGVLVDIGYKSDGLIPAQDFTDSAPKVGDKIEVLIERLESKEGYVILSKKKADSEKKWKKAYDAYKKKDILEAKVTSAVKGGLVVDWEGIRGFVPASQVSKKPDISLDSFVNKNIPIKIIEINRRQGKIVFSHKLGATEKGKFMADKILDELEVGQVRHGVVTSIKSFGAFVDIGGVEGLIHLSELSWSRVNHPSEVLKIGQELDVFVLGVDKVNQKIALGLKELQPDPWVTVKEKFKVGQIVKGKVMRLVKFGAFVKIDEGLEGLVHISELSEKKVDKPEDAVKAGDKVDVKILRILPEEQKIGLSIKEAILEKQKKEFEKQKSEVKVTIGDVIAEKEKQKSEKEAEEEMGEEIEEEQESEEETKSQTQQEV